MTVKITVECDARGCSRSVEISDDCDSAIENEGWLIDHEEGMHYCPTCTPIVKEEMACPESRDPLHDKTCDLITKNIEYASLAALQRFHRIGYNRAARLLEGIAEAGIIKATNRPYGEPQWRLAQ